MNSHNPFTRPAEEFVGEVTEYIDLKADDLKLRTAKGLSITLQRLLVAILFLTLGSIMLMALAFGGVLLLGDVIGSYAAGAFIVAGVFALAILAVFLLRRKLFVNSFVQMFIKLFFEEKGE